MGRSTCTETCRRSRAGFRSRVGADSLLSACRYYEGGVSSVYLWDLEEGFAGVVLLKKSAYARARGRNAEKGLTRLVLQPTMAPEAARAGIQARAYRQARGRRTGADRPVTLLFSPSSPRPLHPLRHLLPSVLSTSCSNLRSARLRDLGTRSHCSLQAHVDRHALHGQGGAKGREGCGRGRGCTGR